MKILFVEDNDGFANDLQPALVSIKGVTGVDRVIDRETAVQKLATDLIDLIVLDLSIPPNPYSDTPAAEHGQTLFHEARVLRPGTPIFILTGEEVEKFSRGLARFGNQVRLWGGSAETETVSFFLKEEVSDLLARVKVLAASFSAMDEVVINTRGKILGLTPVQTRMLKTFARNADGVACDISLLSGGLSDSKVVKAVAMDLARKPQAICAGKLGTAASITSEIQAYERHVKKLAVGACAPLYCAVDQGVGQNGGIFYTLTDDDTLSLFERLVQDGSVGATAVANVRANLQRWSDARTADMVTIGELRQRLITDQDADNLTAKFGLSSIRGIETKKIHVSRSNIHGDLHCGNVLVKSDGAGVLIDFGDAGPGYTCIDPISLELSLIFHPDAVKFRLGENLVGHLASWPDIDAFGHGNSIKSTISACREWSHDVAGSDQSVLGSAYAYVFRQLKYNTMDPKITLDFLKILAEKLN